MARRLLSYEEFAERARALAAAIPKEFLAGVEDVVVHRRVNRHPLLPDVVTLGECEASPLAAMTDAGQVRSIVHLYYGSFVDLARRDDGFDVEEELKETIEHEVQHHIEDRAGVSNLLDEDDLFDAHERFRAGLDVAPGWYRRGERLEPDVYAVGSDLFVELRLRRKELDRHRGKTLRLTVLGDPLDVELPEDVRPGEALTYEGEGLVAEESHAHGHPPPKPPRASQASQPDSSEADSSEADFSETDFSETDFSETDDEPEAGDLHVIPIVR